MSDQKSGNQPGLSPKVRFNVIYVFLAFWGVLILHEAWTRYTTVAEIPYNQFQRLLQEKRLEQIQITQDRIRGSIKDPKDGEKKEFVTTRVEPDLAKELSQYDVKFTGVIESNFLATFLSWVVPVLLFFGFYILLMRRMAAGGGLGGGGFLAIGKSKAKVYVETDLKTTFKDVAGVDEAKQELQEIVNFLKAPQEYGRLGGRMPKGILLVGPPGTGKTLLARAVAGEAGVPFFSISGSEFVEMFVGVGAARVRDLFEQARSKAPCIIFIDELDAMGQSRASQAWAGGHSEKEQTLNQLLVEMDGFDSTSGVVLLAATNRPEILDPALLRAGRFDRQVLVDRPDRAGRIEILKVHAKKVTLSADVSLEKIAALTPGFSGADLANLVNEAALAATRRRAESISADDFTVAVERMIAGLEKKNRVLNPVERKVVAYHEMGHALVAAALPGSDPVHKVSIIPRGIGALGYTIQRPTEDRYLMTRNELEQKMAVLLGGRAAERITFDHLSTGAADDISRATDIARSMVMRYGMDSTLGHVSYDNEPAGFLGQGMPALRQKNFSEETAREIDRSVRELVERAFDRAASLLETNRHLLVESAERLLKEETLTEKELSGIFARISTKEPSGALQVQPL